MRGKKLSLVVFLMVVLVAVFVDTAYAKSVYAIINHQSDIIGAYKINGNLIEYQTEIQAPQHGYRAVDLAIDKNKKYLYLDTNCYIIICQRQTP